MKRKLLTMMLGTVLCVGLFSGCGSSSETTTQNETPTTQTDMENVNLTEEVFGNIEPLAETTPLSIGTISSSTYGFTDYMIEKLGGFEKANIEVERMVFGNGPIVVEAMASGDCDVAEYGIGGTLAGTIGQGFVNLGAAASDYGSLRIYSPNDSEITLAGENPDLPGIYGTATEWEGKEVFIPLGTNLHYVFNKGIEDLGLESDSVKLTHMDVPNINTALLAGKCELGGVWTNYSFGQLNDIATPVMTAEAVDAILIASFAATQETLADEKKALAVEKWLELYFTAVDWMYSSEENKAMAVEWFVEWNEENGVASSAEETLALLDAHKCYSLEDNLEMINGKSTNGEDYSLFVEYNVDPLEFFVEQGNYTNEDLENFAKPENYDFSLIQNIAAKN